MGAVLEDVEFEVRLGLSLPASSSRETPGDDDREDDELEDLFSQYDFEYVPVSSVTSGTFSALLLCDPYH